MGPGISENEHSLGRILKMAWLTILAAMGIALTAPAMAIADSAQFNIEAQALPQALKAFAAQAHMQLLYEYGAVAHAKGNAVIGDLDKRAALEQLLKNSGLEAVYSSDSAVTIRRVGAPSSKPQSQNTNQSQDSKPGSRLQLAQANADQTAGTTSVESQQKQPQGSEIPLQEVIVTAQKRAERLQDVPVPVTALSAESLLENHELRLEDYYAQVPGLSLTTDYRGAPDISIRGLTTGSYTGNPTVSITVDDVAYSASAQVGGGGSTPAPDLDPSDLERIEVLRGPQGTLYGASSLGGLIKYVTVDPSTSEFSGRVETDVSSVYNGSGLGYGERGALNVPINDTMAFRVSAFYRRDPGYIDNVQTGQHGVNSTEADGAHLSVLWRPSDSLSLKLSALVQGERAEGEPFSQSDLTQSALLNTGRVEENTQAYSAILKAKIGRVDLTVSSAYSINSLHDAEDITQAYGGLPGFSATGVVGNDTADTRKFTQEVRASIPLGDTLEWLVGAFYTHEDSFLYSNYVSADPVTGAIVVPSGDTLAPAVYTEYAGFTDLTVHLTQRFDVQIGGRESENRQRYSQRDTGPFASDIDLVDPYVVPGIRSSDNAFTWLLTPRYKVAENLMLYARLASGYRPGGPNPYCAPGLVPCRFNPDRTVNYELGVKGDALDHRFSYDLSVYYIDWRNIQVLTLIPTDNFLPAIQNAGGAKSQGVELSLEAKPWTGMMARLSASFDDAELTQGFPANSTAYGVPGDRLPYSSRFTGSLSLQQDVHLSSSVTGFVGGAVSYVGDRYDVFPYAPPPTAVRSRFPAYAKTDLRAGILHESWTVNLFASNLLDRRGILALYPFNGGPYIYNTPRTVGLAVTKKF